MPDLIPGGKSDKIPPSRFPPEKVRKGAKVESEHTSNKAVAREIARDHLTEDPNYYEKLQKMEKKAMLDAFADELTKIAMGGVEAAQKAETNIGHSGIKSQAPIIQAENRGHYLEARKLYKRGPARKAFAAEQLNKGTPFATELARRSSKKFMRFARAVG